MSLLIKHTIININNAFIWFYRLWSPETSDWETFRSQMNANLSSEMKIDNNSINC